MATSILFNMWNSLAKINSKIERMISVNGLSYIEVSQRKLNPGGVHSGSRFNLMLLV